MTAAAANAKLEWGPARRPTQHHAFKCEMIAEITQPNRPTADKVAARHGEIRKHHRKQRKRRAEENPSKPADIRLAHLRWGELIRLMRYRYGIVLPDSDEGRRDFRLLINYALLTRRKPELVAEIWAPWLDEDEADQLAAQRPVLHKADDLAEKVCLHYCDRQALGITTIGAIDCDQDERNRLRLERRNEAKRLKRAAANEEATTMTTKTAPMVLKPKAKKVLAKIDGAEIAVPDLIRRLANLKEFRKLAKPRDEVYRVLDHLKALGLVTDRYAPGPRGGRQSRFVSRR